MTDAERSIVPTPELREGYEYDLSHLVGPDGSLVGYTAAAFGSAAFPHIVEWWERAREERTAA